jgi:hypothetical protein
VIALADNEQCGIAALGQDRLAVVMDIASLTGLP